MSSKASQLSDPILAAHQAYISAVKTRDLDKLTSLLDAETIFMPPNDTSLFGPVEVREWWKEYFDYFRVTSITEIVGMEGDIITTQDLFTFQFQGEGSDGKLVGTFKSGGIRPAFLPRSAGD